MKVSLTAALEASSSAPILFRGSLEQAFALASRLGYDGVEIHIGHPGDIDRQGTRELCRRTGLGVPTIGTGMAAGKEGLSFTDAEAAVRARAVERILLHIELAAYLNSGVTIGLIYGRLGQPVEQRGSREQAALECLKACCQAAEQKGVTLFLESINRYETDCLNTLEEAVQRIERIGSPSLKLLADTFHMNIEEVDLAASLRRCRQHLGHVHLADSNREAPGHGHLDVGGVLRVLSDIGFEGYVSLEVLPRPDGRQAAKDGIACVRNLLAGG